PLATNDGASRSNAHSSAVKASLFAMSISFDSDAMSDIHSVKRQVFMGTPNLPSPSMAYHLVSQSASSPARNGVPRKIGAEVKPSLKIWKAVYDSPGYRLSLEALAPAFSGRTGSARVSSRDRLVSNSWALRSSAAR